MRPNPFWIVLLALLGAAGVLSAQEPTPRQSWQRAVDLFGQGHEFTAEELQGLEILSGRLIDAGDADLAADLDLVRRGAAGRAQLVEARARSAADPQADRLAWEASAPRPNQAFARGVRDVGAVGLGLSSWALVGLTALVDRNEAAGRNSDPVGAPLALALGTAVVSLFAVLWGQSQL